MATGLIDIMKRASIDAVDNAQMCDLRYGKVISLNPLKVQITNQFIIPESMLVVPTKFTTVALNIILGDEQVIVDNMLKVGDKVVLLRKQGGQSYFILDRI